MNKFNIDKYKEEFTYLYLNKTITDVVNRFNISIATVNKYAKELNLRKGSSRPTNRKLIFDE